MNAYFSSSRLCRSFVCADVEGRVFSNIKAVGSTGGSACVCSDQPSGRGKLKKAVKICVFTGAQRLFCTCTCCFPGKNRQTA
jgi:hypothetical protein